MARFIVELSRELQQVASVEIEAASDVDAEAAALAILKNGDPLDWEDETIEREQVECSYELEVEDGNPDKYDDR